MENSHEYGVSDSGIEEERLGYVVVVELIEINRVF